MHQLVSFINTVQPGLLILQYDSICSHRLTFIPSQLLLYWCPSRVCPQPITFSIYTSPISTIAHSHKVCQQQYADDTQLYVALSPVNYYHDISALQSRLTSLQAWFCESGMTLNPSKSVAILFGTSQRLKSVSDLKCITAANTAIPLVLRSIPILQWDFTLRHYLSPASIISALLDKSVHPWMMP